MVILKKGQKFLWHLYDPLDECSFSQCGLLLFHNSTGVTFVCPTPWQTLENI